MIDLVVRNASQILTCFVDGARPPYSGPLQAAIGLTEGGVAVNDGRILDVNRSMERLTGYSRDEMVGQMWLDLSWMPSEQAEEFMRRMRQERWVAGMEVSFNHRETGAERQVVLAAEITQIGGEEVWVIGFWGDLRSNPRSLKVPPRSPR